MKRSLQIIITEARIAGISFGEEREKGLAFWKTGGEEGSWGAGAPCFLPLRGTYIFVPFIIIL